MLVEDIWDDAYNSAISKIKATAIAHVNNGDFYPGVFWQVISDMMLRGAPKFEINEFLTQHKNEIIDYLSNRWANGEPHREEYDLYTLISTVYSFKKNVDIEWPELLTIINNLKPKIVKMLLILIKDDEIPKIKTLMSDLINIGIKWNELDVIKKSLTHNDVTLYEGNTEKDHIEKIVNHLYRVLNTDLIYPLILQSTITKLLDFTKLTDSEIRDIFVPMRTEIVNCIGRNWSWLIDCKQYQLDSNAFGILSGLCLLKKVTGIDWPEFHKQIEDAKTLIIKAMLILMSENEFKRVESYINYLHTLNINWPEIDVIEKSLQHDATTLYEGRYEREYVEKSVKWLHEILASGKFESAMFHTFIVGLLNNGQLDAAELKAIFVPIRKELVNYQRNHWSGGGKEYRIEYDMFMLLAGIYLFEKKVGLVWPEFHKQIEDMKPSIIKMLLTLMSESEFRRVSKYLEFLESLNFKWPELNVIQKSLNVEYDTTNQPTQHLYEAASCYYLHGNVARHINDLDDMLYNYGAYDEDRIEGKTPEDIEADIPWCLAMIGLTDSVVPNRILMIQPHKESILKIMLMAIRDPDDFDQGSLGAKEGLAAMVKGIRRLGAKWPELDIIEKSLQHDADNKNKLNEAGESSHWARWLKDFKQNLIEENYEALEDLAEYTHSFMPKQDLNKVVAKYKTFVIRQILTCITELSEAHMKEFLKEVIDGLRKGNVNWPELNTIEHSLIHSRTIELDEEDTYDLDNASEAEQIDVIERSPFNISDIRRPSKTVQLVAVSKQGYALGHIKRPSYEVKLAAVKQNGRAIGYVKNPSEELQMTAIKENPLAFLCIRTPSVNVLNQCKHEIIKAVLSQILVNSSYRPIKSMLLHLRVVNWPELDIIKHSITNSSNSKLKNIDESIKMTPKAKADLLSMLETSFQYGYFTNAFRNLYSSQETVDSWPELDKFLIDNKHRIIDLLNRMLQVGSIRNMVSIVSTLAKIKVNWPEIIPIITDCKKDIIENILKYMKDDEVDSALYIAADLIDLGLNWPELSIIKKSAEHEINNKKV